MKIDIRTRGFSLTPGLRTHVERRLTFALDRYEQRVARVRVTLGDLNGPRGGQDKRCHVDVLVRGAGTVLARAVDADAYAALDVAAHRARRGVARALERERPTAGEPPSPPRARKAPPSLAGRNGHADRRHPA